MKRIIASVVVTGIMFCGVQAFAADTTSTPTGGTPMSGKHMMKDCMAKQKAKDSTMAMADMRKACKSEMMARKAQMKNGNTPPADTTSAPKP